MNKEFEYPRDFKGVWIQKEIYLNKNLDATEKILYAEICSLDNEDTDGCVASNEYLANFCQCSARKVSAGISKLIKMGYIHVAKNDGRKRYLRQGSQNTQASHAKSARQKCKKCNSETQDLPYSNIENNIENNISNNIDINASNSKELNGYNINASFPEKKRTQTPFLDMNNCTLEEIENHYSIRCKKIAQKHNIADAEKIRDAAKIIAYFCQKYYEVFRELHPVLSDRALERVFINFCFPPELLDENGITTYGHYEEMIDRYFATEYGKYNLSGIVPDYSISHFMSDEILTNLCKNVFGIPHL